MCQPQGGQSSYGGGGSYGSSFNPSKYGLQMPSQGQLKPAFSSTFNQGNAPWMMDGNAGGFKSQDTFMPKPQFQRDEAMLTGGIKPYRPPVDYFPAKPGTPDFQQTSFYRSPADVAGLQQSAPPKVYTPPSPPTPWQPPPVYTPPPPQPPSPTPTPPPPQQPPGQPTPTPSPTSGPYAALLAANPGSYLDANGVPRFGEQPAFNPGAGQFGQYGQPGQNGFSLEVKNGQNYINNGTQSTLFSPEGLNQGSNLAPQNFVNYMNSFQRR